MEEFLKGFKISDARPMKPKGAARPGVDPAVAARNKLIAAVQEHKRFVEAEIEGREPKKFKSVMVNGAETQQEQRLTKWYFNNQDGEGWRTVIRYGTTALVFDGGPTIGVGKDMSGLLKAYDKIIEATEAGKLDEHIAKAKIKAPRSSRQVAAGDAEVEQQEDDDEEGNAAASSKMPASRTVQPRFKATTRR